jgi:hypothetical protein
MHPVLMHEIGKEVTRAGKIYVSFTFMNVARILDTDGATGAFSWVLIDFPIIITRKFRH